MPPPSRLVVCGRRCGCAICTRTFSAAPVAALPNELLRGVFLHLPRRGRGDTDIYDRLRAAHVCKSWREVAVGYSELWTDVVYSNPALTTLMLEWSRPRPLTVKFATTEEEEDEWDGLYEDVVRKRVESTRIALADLSRVETIDLVAPRDCLLQLFPCLARPALRLRSLRLGLTDYRLEMDLPMPACLFAGVARRLDTVVMERGIDIDWDSPIFSCDLRRLSLAPRYIHAESLAGVLQAQPLLRELALERDVLSHQWWHGASIDLPCLEHLRLNGQSRSLSRTLEVIHVPPQASVDLAVTEILVQPPNLRRLIEEDLAAFLQDVRGILPLRGSASTLYLSSEACAVTVRYWPSVHPHAPITFNDIGDAHLALGPAVSIAFRDPGVDYPLPFSFRAMLARLLADALPLESVRSLTLGALVDVPALTPLLVPMDGARTLHVERIDGLPNVLNYILTDVMAFVRMFRPRPWTPLLPSLCEMTFVRVTFPVGRRGEKTGWETLMMFMSQREFRNVVLSTLSVVDCKGVGTLSGKPASTMIIKRKGKEEVKEYVF